MGEQLEAVLTGLERILETYDPACLTASAACSVYAKSAKGQRLFGTMNALTAPRIESSGIWKERGEVSCASFLASIEGVSRGHARATLDVGRALGELPRCEKAARKGDLSQPKLAELTSVLASDPKSESALLAGAAGEPLWTTKDRCQRARATNAERDPIEAVRRIRAGRHLTWWSDAEGAFCFQGRDTADRGAVMRDRIEQLANDLRRSQARESTNGDGSPRATDGALRADALFAVLSDCERPSPRDERGEPASGDRTGGTQRGGLVARSGSTTAKRGRTGARRDSATSSGSPAPSTQAIVNRPPRCNVLVRVDLDALLRGRALPGECCEIDGQGPIPVPMARDLANDSFLRLVFHKSGDIRSVATLGRTVKRSLRIALAARDRCCVVPGCGSTTGLEIDHVVPFSQGGPTELDNLALLCHHHHFLKTFSGWILTMEPPRRTDGPPVWRFEPGPPPGRDRALAHGLPSCNRCLQLE